MAADAMIPSYKGDGIEEGEDMRGDDWKGRHEEAGTIFLPRHYSQGKPTLKQRRQSKSETSDYVE